MRRKSMRDLVFCPKCKEENEKSKVHEGHSAKTLMYWPPFFDEDGRYHNHDRNTTTRNYSCSRGHKWVESSRGNCWCGWSGGDSSSYYSNFELDERLL